MSPPAAATLGMSPAARYNHNLKVLRKRDPSITSIFDQFSHVAVYHHNGTSWQKNGYEGSMFLFERWTSFFVPVASQSNIFPGANIRRMASTF
jgi:hypothetical protein